MIRKIIQINEEKCNGCGACADACHEGAIGMVNGKARLLRDDYCDGLGDCLPACPTGAITFVEREAAAYDEAAVLANKAKTGKKLPCGCPGTHSQTIRPKAEATADTENASTPGACKQAFPMAGTNSPCSGKRALFSRRRPFDCGRLYGLCLCRLSPAFYQKPYYAGWLSKAGRCRLCRKADCHFTEPFD